jgi:hypothetical protein
VTGLAALFSTALGFNADVAAGFDSAVPAAALVAATCAFCEQAASAEIAAQPRTQRAIRGANPSIDLALSFRMVVMSRCNVYAALPTCLFLRTSSPNGGSS